jgi:hypothetical protein
MVYSKESIFCNRDFAQPETLSPAHEEPWQLKYRVQDQDLRTLLAATFA